MSSTQEVLNMTKSFLYHPNVDIYTEITFLWTRKKISKLFAPEMSPLVCFSLYNCGAIYIYFFM